MKYISSNGSIARNFYFRHRYFLSMSLCVHLSLVLSGILLFLLNNTCRVCVMMNVILTLAFINSTKRRTNGHRLSVCLSVYLLVGLFNSYWMDFVQYKAEHRN